MKRRLCVIAVMSIATWTAWATPDDWQLWTDQGAAGKLNDKFSIGINQQQRFSDQEGGINLYHIFAGVTYSATDWMKINVGQRQLFFKKGNEWTEETRPIVNVTLTRKYPSLTLSDRSRFEVRMREGNSDIFRYRNMLKIASNESVLGWKPYISDEIFFDSDQGDLTRNRLYIGLASKPMDHLKTGVWGLWQATDKGAYWQDVLALGISINGSF